MTRKITSIATVVLLAFVWVSAITGCGGPSTPKPESKSPETSTGAAPSTAPGGTGAGSESEPIKIGFVGSLSGTQAELGMYCKNGVEMAVDHINASGGINGRKVTLIAEDDELNPSKALSAVTKLIEKDKVVFFIGPNNTPQTMAVMELAQRYKIPEVTTNCSGPAITRSGNEWIFRLHADDILQAHALVDYIQANVKPKAIAVLYINNDYGKGGMTEVVNRLKDKYNTAPVAIEAYNPGDKDFSSQILKIKGKNADVIIMSADYPEGALIAKQAHGVGYRPLLAGLGGISQAGYPKLAQEDGVGTISTIAYFPSPRNEKEKKWLDEAVQKYGYIPTFAFAQSYDAMMIFAEAIKQVGPDRQKVRDILRGGLSIDGITGKVAFDNTGNAIREVYIISVKDPKAEKEKVWEVLWPK